MVKNVTLKDQGSYSCETKDDKATFQVKVRGMNYCNKGEYSCEAAGQKLTFKIHVTEPEFVFTNKEKVQKVVKAATTEKCHAELRGGPGEDGEVK
ncbi:obscurin-like isoform X2 [Coturnix japonica]|uniref:obscurin-like isoform X2 n=1 Tax=Coturnix japonica TaxID=93934 RepID=UPI000776FA77|nr:obscurin-like isoform X2 [Coturnix japonica]